MTLESARHGDALLAFVDPTIGQAVLDALDEPVFILDPTSNLLRPLNSSALACCGPDDRSVMVDRVLPELMPENLDGQSAATILTKWRDVAGQSRDVRIDLRPLFAVGGALVIVRPREVPPDHPSAAPRDAFDDWLHDPLTRLPNRRLFERRMERAIERAASTPYTFALLFVDLDGFKAVNDRLGHLRGDSVLTAAAQRLVAAVRPQDMVARRDGDEFTVLLDDLVDPADAIAVAQRILQHLQQPVPVEGYDGPTTVAVGASIGIAIGGHDQPAQASDQLIARADIAMYRAKATGGNRYAVDQPHRDISKALPR